MICAGNKDHPYECGQEAVTIIAGFSQCDKHAKEVAMRFNLIRAAEIAKTQQIKNLKWPSKPDLIPSHSISSLGDLKKGVWKRKP